MPILTTGTPFSAASAQKRREHEQGVEEGERGPRGRHGPCVLPDEERPPRDGLREQREYCAALELRREQARTCTERYEKRIRPNKQKRDFVEIARSPMRAEWLRHRQRHDERAGQDEHGEDVVAPPQLDEREPHQRAKLSEKTKDVSA